MGSQTSVNKTGIRLETEHQTIESLNP